MQSLFPRLLDLERTHGSVLRAPIVRHPWGPTFRSGHSGRLPFPLAPRRDGVARRGTRAAAGSGRASLRRARRSSRARRTRAGAPAGTPRAPSSWRRPRTPRRRCWRRSMLKRPPCARKCRMSRPPASRSPGRERRSRIHWPAPVSSSPRQRRGTCASPRARGCRRSGTSARRRERRSCARSSAARTIRTSLSLTDEALVAAVRADLGRVLGITARAVAGAGPSLAPRRRATPRRPPRARRHDRAPPRRPRRAVRRRQRLPRRGHSRLHRRRAPRRAAAAESLAATHTESLRRDTTELFTGGTGDKSSLLIS